MNVYLDIDGVLLANDKQAALYADEFIAYIVGNHDVYWLTTHVRGDTVWVHEYLSKYFSPETMGLLKTIKLTNWVENKTEAIDFSQPFVWYDDDLFDEEKQLLVERNALDSFEHIDLAIDPNQLINIVSSA